MKTIRTKEEFETVWSEAGALVAYFGATWCWPCRQLEPLLRKLEKENTGTIFVKVDIDKNEELSETFNVLSVPTLLLVRKGKLQSRMVGLQSYAALRKKAKGLLKPSRNE
ncbi:MAG: thioredoxin family protein [Candidatus Thermoplasmatota archaeon]|nr:thioredoxin family protein [Candidatus Thermoplasmatota archaeon]